MYSVVKLLRHEEYLIHNDHSCIECKKQYTDPTDLIAHIYASKHKPHPKDLEINVLECPFEGCEYVSTQFSSFKKSKEKTAILSYI